MKYLPFPLKITRQELGRSKESIRNGKSSRREEGDSLPLTFKTKRTSSK
jgi:hypothetical protein